MTHVEDISGPRGEASIHRCETSITSSLLDIPHQYVVHCNGRQVGHYRTLHDARSAAHRAVGNTRG